MTRKNAVFYYLIITFIVIAECYIILTEQVISHFKLPNWMVGLRLFFVFSRCIIWPILLVILEMLYPKINQAKASIFGLAAGLIVFGCYFITYTEIDILVIKTRGYEVTCLVAVFMILKNSLQLFMLNKQKTECMEN